MKIEERVASGLRAQTETLLPPPTDLAAIRSAARTQSHRRAALGAVCAVAVLLVVVASGVTDVGRDRSDGSLPAAPLPSPTSTEPIDTATWPTYTSDRYDLTVGYPSDWTVVPSSRRWRPDIDVSDVTSPAQEAFGSPTGDVRVSVWSAPLDRTTIETTADIEAWVEDYCEASYDTPCTGIHDRAVPLCLEKWDCHPGLLVAFQDDVQAFFSGGIYDADAMTVVAVWRAESDPSVVPYGGAQRLLEGFLSTMSVWPESTPRSERD